MSTAQTIINRAFRLATGSTDTPSGSDNATALEALNNLLASWRNNQLMAYATTDLTVPMVAGTSSYTIGPSGDLVATKPTNILYAFMRLANIDYPVEIVDSTDYNRVEDKTSTGDLVYIASYNSTPTNGTLKVWPVPTGTPNLYLTVNYPLTSLAAADTITLPAGWDRALGANLALEIAPEYGQELPASVHDLARKSLMEIKRINSSAPKLQSGLTALLGTSKTTSNILIGP